MLGPVQIDQDVAIHIPPSEDVLQCHIVGQVEAGRVLDIDSFNDVEFRNTIVNAVVSASFLLGDEFIHGSIRSEEHTSELQSLMRISYAVFCLKKKNKNKHQKL